MTIIIHTWRALHHRSCLQRFLYSNIVNNTITIALNPALTSLEEENWALFITKTRNLAQGGRNSQGERDCSCMWSQSRLYKCLTKPNMSLIECKCQSGGWSDWHLSLLTEASPKTHLDEPKHVEERGRAKFPIKDVEDQLWIWFEHLLQSRICQI